MAPLSGQEEDDTLTEANVGGADSRQFPDPPADLINRRTLDGERLIAVFSALVEPIGRSLPSSSEVVLHDLSLLPNSVVAAYGTITQRKAGDPATDLLLEQSVSGFRDVIDYRTRLRDGRQLRSSTMIIRDVFGNPVAALCINIDLTAWSSAGELVMGMLGLPWPPAGNGEEGTETSPPGRPPGSPAPETFAESISDLASSLIDNAVAKVGVPVELMKKEHKLEVVRDLKSRGMFLIREAVEIVAEALDVTRFTIYNYLNELSDDDTTDRRSSPRRPRKAEDRS